VGRNWDGLGTTLHGQFDANVYQDLADELQRSSMLLIKATRTQLEEIQQKYLSLGEQRLVEKLRSSLLSDETAFENAGKTRFDAADAQLVKAIADLPKTVSNANTGSLQTAAAHWKDSAAEYQTKRKDELDRRLQQFDQAVQDWQRYVQNRFDESVKQVDGIETELNNALKDLNGNITSLQSHYAAIKDGQEQLNAYLKEKSAFELGALGFLKGIGLNVSPTSISSFVESVTSKYQERLNAVVDRFNNETSAPLPKV
jgi:uncharacterized protein YukE